MFPHSIVISTWLFTNSTTDSAPKNLWDVHPNQKPFLHGVYKQECEPFHRKRFKKHVNPLGCLILGKQAYVAAYIIYINVSYIYIYIYLHLLYTVYICPMAPPLKRSVLGTATWKASEYFSRLSQKPTWCTDRGIRKEDEETLCAVLRLCLQERQESSGWHESCWGNIDSYVTGRDELFEAKAASTMFSWVFEKDYQPTYQPDPTRLFSARHDFRHWHWW